MLIHQQFAGIAIILGLFLAAGSVPLSTGAIYYSASVAIPFGVLSYDNDLSIIPLLQKYHKNPHDYILNSGYFEYFPDQRKVIGGASLAEVQDAIDKAKMLTYPIDSVAYDLEHWEKTPASEQNNLPLAVINASNLAHAAGYRSAFSPDGPYLVNYYQVVDWKRVDLLVMQLPQYATNPALFSENVKNIANYVRSVNPNIEVFAEVSLSQTDANQTISAIGAIKGMVNGIVVLYIQDGDGSCQYCTQENLDKVLAFVTSQSASPVANAGPDVVVPDEKTVTLDGRASFDPNDDILNYSWAQVDGYPVSLINANTSQAQFFAPKILSDIKSSFRLTVTDSIGAYSTDDVLVTVKNLGPYPTVLSTNLYQTTVPYGKNITVTGVLSDPELTRSGMPGRIITFNGTGINSRGAPISTVTDNSGKFTMSFSTPNLVASGWTIQAHFAGDSNYLASDSTIKTFDTKKHVTTIELGTSAKTVPWGGPLTISLSIRDIDNGNIGISNKAIKFDGSVFGSRSASQNTNGTGMIVINSNAPNLVASGWTIQAHFAGDSNYLASDSTIKTFDTTKHSTQLSMSTYRTEITTGNTFSIGGKLVDKTTSQPLTGRTVSFTTSSVLFKIPSTLTSTDGTYSLKSLVAPSIGTYTLSASFAEDSLYYSASSSQQTLTVK